MTPDLPSSPQDAAAPPAPPPPKKKGLSKGCIAAIVASVLMLAAIIALGTLGVFGGRILIKNARALEAKAVMKGMEIAIKGYKTEYLKLPSIGLAASTSDTSYSTVDPDGNALIDILYGTDLKNNPRQIRFWDSPRSKLSGAGYTPGVGLNDPWGKVGYRIILDYDKDGLITDPEGVAGPIKADVLLYSAGPDGDFSSWKDNVCSWK